MCLAVPGKLISWKDRSGPFASGLVEFGGVRREVALVCVSDAQVGDYLLVHAGIAISRIAAAEAERMLATLAELDIAQQDLGPTSDRTAQDAHG